MNEELSQNLKGTISTVKDNITQEVGLSVDNLVRKTNDAIQNLGGKIESTTAKVTTFWEFKIMQVLIFWTSIIGMLFFVGNEALKIYGIILPSIVFQVSYPLFFIPILIYLLIQLWKGICFVFELIVDKIRYGI